MLTISLCNTLNLYPSFTLQAIYLGLLEILSQFILKDVQFPQDHSKTLLS